MAPAQESTQVIAMHPASAHLPPARPSPQSRLVEQGAGVGDASGRRRTVKMKCEDFVDLEHLFGAGVGFSRRGPAAV